MLAVAASGAAASVLPAKRASAAISDADLARFDPFSSLENYYRFLRPKLFNYEQGRPFLDALLARYQIQRNVYDGERVLIGMFILWRTIAGKTERIKFSRAAQKLASLVAKDFPGHPSGHVWGGVFFGTEQLVAGILEAAHLSPEIQNRLDQAIKVDETYLYGLPHLLAAKLYFKAPAFPVSVGNYDKAWRHIEAAAKFAERKFAPYYVVLAEGELLTKGKEAAFATLDRMQPEVKPTNAAEAYGLDSMISDGLAFREAVETGKYNKYLWDSFLLLAKPGLP